MASDYASTDSDAALDRLHRADPVMARLIDADPDFNFQAAYDLTK